MGQTEHHYLIFETAAGVCGIAWNDARHHALPVTDRKRRRRRPTFCCARRTAPNPGIPTPDVAEAVAAAKRYFAGEQTDFSGFALDLDDQDAFFKQVYIAARQVGWGRTTTYGTLAKDLGAGPEAARDVGQAMAKNPVPLIIPCHRVLAAGGKVGGFSAPGGAATKIHMLKLEGVSVEPPPPAQRSFSILGRL